MEIQNIFFNTGVDLASVILIILASAIIGFAIALFYKRTHEGVSYSQSFVQSLVVLLPIGSLVFYLVSQNVAAAIGLFGAFSLIRFRTSVKEVRDILFIFWTLVTSLLLTTTGFIPTAVVTLMIGILLMILKQTSFGKFHTYDTILKYQLETKKLDHSQVSAFLADYVKTQEILQVKNLSSGKLLEISLGLKLKKNVATESVVQELSQMKGIVQAKMLSTKRHTEY